jgi:hypothetical protein
LIKKLYAATAAGCEQLREDDGVATETSAELRALTVAKLKVLCKSRGLAISGRKAVLVARLAAIGSSEAGAGEVEARGQCRRGGGQCRRVEASAGEVEASAGDDDDDMAHRTPVSRFWSKEAEAADDDTSEESGEESTSYTDQ